MPGVPHGRACDACRSQKKKCDYATPSCSRCQRLGLECAGSGERRFVFIDQRCRRRRPEQQQQRVNTATSLSLAVSRPALSSASFVSGATRMSPSVPQTDVQTLIGAFVSALAPTTVRVNLVQTYGPFLAMVPPRLGTNAALDNSARAVVRAHQDACLGRPAAEQSLASYALAIRTLSRCLDDLDTAPSTETVCAIIMVMMCQWQAFGWVRDRREVACTGHDARFDRLVSGLYDDNDEGDDDDTILMRRVRIPRLLARAREARRNSRISSPESSGIFMELYALYESARGHSRRLRTPGTAAVAVPQYLGVPTSISPHGMRLVVACVCSCMLRGLLLGGRDQQQQQPRSPFEDALCREAEELADAAFVLAREAARGQDMGAGHVILNCLVTWVCTGDAGKRARIQGVYEEFLCQFRRAWASGKGVVMWEALAADLFLVSDP
ncbi:hypothetical protein PG985_012818 [Apiospora marii]|uniref:uncharacterized protein n=1 Tax=Apiospora marii TaxID=335849 RepID=UPI00312FE22A